MKRLMMLSAFIAAAAFAADVTGTWKATADTPNGTIERTFVFKVDGNKLTGETTSRMFGKSAITDGRIDGDNLSFTIHVKYEGNDMQINYKGKASGDQINFNVEIPNGGPTLEYVAKKVS